MDSVLGLLLLIVFFVGPLLLFEGAAQRWGVDSRDPIVDDHRR